MHAYYRRSFFSGLPSAFEASPLMRVPDEIRECVVFIQTIFNETPRTVGTAFFTCVDVGGTGFSASYAVTAKHCLVDAAGNVPDRIELVVNDTSGGRDVISTRYADWSIHPTADVAVCNVYIDATRHQALMIDAPLFADAEFIADRKVGPGDEVFVTGLLVYHPGETRNMPVVRLGCIAAMPDDPVVMETGVDTVVLAEVRSLGGLSGSPVFLHLPFMRDMPGGGKVLTSNEPVVAGSGGTWRLLGVMHGLYQVDENDPESELPAGVDRGLNAGIAVVVYADRILDLLNHPDFVEGRKMSEEQIRKGQMPKPTSVPSGKASEDSEFERFDNLLGELVNTPKLKPEDELSAS